ncbi:MAG TPA: DUF4097 family beta strand repeat-containing protein, partial [Conexibacter sp.]|nr:DUF4097 family beta strand repeat-containing protein [Conexibacter sp.]
VSVVGERRRGVRVDMAIQRGMWRGGWQPRVAVERDGRRLELQSHCSVWAHIGVGDCGASFTVRVPRGTRLAVDAGSGDVRVAGLARGATVDTSSGDVHAQDVAGPLRVLASAGDVDVEGYRGADVTLQAGSGDVELDARSAPRRVRATTGPGDVALEVPDRAYRVAVRTGTGDRSVHVREDPHAPRSIVATTGAGDVSVAAPGR